MRVRLIHVTGVDLNLFDFDYDLTWAAFLMNANEKVYGRYGGRDASDPDARISLDGLRYAMRAALEAHRREPKDARPRRAGPALRAEDYPAAQRAGGGCIHCHQVNEIRREHLKSLGQWQRDDLWVFPLPENVGLTLDVAQGNRVRAVRPDSPAAKLGIQAGDYVRALNGYPVASFADAQYALHKAPKAGRVPITWTHGKDEQRGELDLAEGWRKTNLTWRPSLLDILPSFPLYGDELTAAEKQKLGLSPARLAFRQQDPVPKRAAAAGVRPNDVIVGLDGQEMELSLEQFLAHVRRNHLVGDRVTLNLLRDGRRVDVPLTLR